MNLPSPQLPIRLLQLLALLCLFVSQAAFAADIDGRQLTALWGLPFAGILLCIALFPLLAPKVWHHHYGKIAAFWALLFLVPFALKFGLSAAYGALIHALIAEYIPFVILLIALFVVSGGIYIKGNLHGSPLLNTSILAIGAVAASFMGTTGASMLLIRPLIRANDNRQHKVHVFVFFIFIVSNVGGSLTPLGDPPLFLGFLKGVDFFWTAQHLSLKTLFILCILLASFYALDSYYYHKREEVLKFDPTPDTGGLGFDGKVNFVLLLGIMALVLMSGIWASPIQWLIAGTPIGLPGIVRDIGLVLIAFASLKLTAQSVHQANQFSWGPMIEVAKLFAGIFLTIIPVIAILKTGVDGPFGAIVSSVTRADGSPNPFAYFWATGALSAFLDNAPTYLVFFNLAGGDAQTLMTTHAATLAAISAGAVFMGAMSYIGNAPNLMVKAIVEDRGVKMPSFFAYIAWAVCFLLPVLALMAWIWFG